MTHADISGVTFMRCTLCAGVWIEEQAMGALLRASKRAPDASELEVRNDGSPQRPCPICHDSMDIAWLGSLQLDRCPKHGVWFDQEELQRARAGNIHPETKVIVEGADAELLSALLKDLDADN